MKHIDWKQIDKKEELRQMVAEAVRGLFHRELTPSEAETLLALCRIARYRKGEEFSFDTDEERAYIMLEGACVYYLRDKASSEKEMVGFVRKGALIHAYPHVTHRARIWFEAESYILQIPVTAFEIVCDKTRIEKALAGAYWDALLDACAFLRKSWKEKRDILEEEGLLHHLSQNVTAHFLRVERTTIHRAKRAK